jgi:catechol 2,3-dioxygenase-like lactoylglutathione lyase family enzyme
MPAITGVSHVSLTVSDLGKSEAWYRDVLGFQKLLEVDEGGGRIRSVLAHPDSGALIPLVRHENSYGDLFSELRTGLDHLSFGVSGRDELEAWQRHLDDLGVEHGPIAEAEPAPGMRFALIAFRDPDNIQLEVFTMLDA